MKLPSIKDRIRTALADGPMPYAMLAEAVFPREHFPRAFRGAVKGGPPGCYMPLSRAIREMGLQTSRHLGAGHRMVYPGR